MTDPSLPHGLYGAPPPDLADVPTGSIQFSPFVPGAADLAERASASLSAATLLAPPGAVERRFVLAHALRALAPGGRLTALAPKDKGGSRLRGELESFGCAATERSKAHHRICEVERPADIRGIAEAIEEGGPREIAGIWTQPGIFAFDRVDPGTALLLRHLPALAGTGADLGSGLGLIARAALRSDAVSKLHLAEIDRRAVEMGRRNVPDPRAVHHWTDARTLALADLDFVVTNPPFHAQGAETRTLGQDFVRTAARMLRRGGTLHLVANRHLPYETVLREAFRQVETPVEEGGYKLFEARK